ncbi:hypothetical protein PR048_013381 [Dryococelus australis]|uniref:Uncharacterized protein n=1 Tax=Dryococelus australis TaxID=614101 RepID=A0ABQ9HSV7_9NEOP|nr:hypothetical protein PR048_013381 [Dryococelus australis]
MKGHQGDLTSTNCPTNPSSRPQSAKCLLYLSLSRGVGEWKEGQQPRDTTLIAAIIKSQTNLSPDKISDTYPSPTAEGNSHPDKLREELQKLQEDKNQYQGIAKESLRKLLQEKLDAVQKLNDLERPLPPPLHSGAAPYSLQLPSSALKTSLLRAAPISSLKFTSLHFTTLDWTGLDWTGLDWTGLDSTAPFEILGVAAHTEVSEASPELVRIIEDYLLMNAKLQKIPRHGEKPPVVVRLLASHHGKLGSIPNGLLP